jgi:hypothetical protein
MGLQLLETDPQRILLAGNGMSGRGIQFRVLGPDEKRAVDLDAARAAGKDANSSTVYELAVRDGMTRMLTHITEQCGVTDLQQPDLVWHKVSLTDLAVPDSEYYLWRKGLFTTRDLEFIEAIYSRIHAVSKDEFEAAMGKAMRVSAA